MFEKAKTNMFVREFVRKKFFHLLRARELRFRKVCMVLYKRWRGGVGGRRVLADFVPPASCLGWMFWPD